jgi:RNA polymerase sigma-70 factor (ECF subfamily)
MGTEQAVVIHAEDKRLVARLLAGDEPAFRRFFDDHYRRLYRFALPRVGHDAAAAEDVVQTTLVKALRKLSSYRGEAQLFTWLCAICRSEVADWMRKRGGREARVVLTEDSAEARAVVDSLQAEHPDDELRRDEAARLIQVALDRLPPRYGDALEWKYIEGYSAQEIAARLNVGVDAANSLLARAKRAFKEVYGALTGGEILVHSGKEVS